MYDIYIYICIIIYIYRSVGTCWNPFVRDAMVSYNCPVPTVSIMSLPGWTFTAGVYYPPGFDASKLMPVKAGHVSQGGPRG